MAHSAADIAFTLDFPTLMVISTWIAALLGLFLFLAWISDRTTHALVWWSTAYVIGGSAVALWSSGHALDSAMARDIPSALLFLALGMIWTGAREFHGRRVSPLPLVAGAVIWLLIARWPMFAEGTTGRLIFSSLGIAVYTFMTAFEVWRDRRARPHPRWWATMVPALHASVFLCPVVLPAMLPSTGASITSDKWTAALTVATLLYAVGTACLILALVQDRSIRLHRDAANTDVLTGLINRRAFIEYAQKLIGQCARRGQPVTLMMFDLDHFKSINDRFGHAVGDDALKLFARTASNCMRVDDAIGRLGGEEFAAVVPGADDVAAGIAERIRTAFQSVGVTISGHEMHATVSIGAAWTNENISVEQVLLEADAALYRAKESGRNRLEIAVAPVGRRGSGRELAGATSGAGVDGRPRPRAPFALSQGLRWIAEGGRLIRAAIAGMPARGKQHLVVAQEAEVAHVGARAPTMNLS